MPWRVPEGAETLRTEDATSLCLFKEGQYQVELYSLDDIYGIVRHGHPGVHVTQVAINFENAKIGDVVNHIDDEQFHGGKKSKDGRVVPGTILAFQLWNEGLIPTSLAARWKGPVLGPKHEGVIRKFYPDSIIKDGYCFSN